MPYKDKEKQKINAKKHYENNKSVYLARSKKRKIEYGKKIKDYLRKFKEDRGCKDCKVKYPHYMMDFDHKKDKEFHLSIAHSRLYSMDRIKKEIKKCDVVCANCHRKRTWLRLRKNLK
jgi:hypothetical protein